MAEDNKVKASTDLGVPEGMIGHDDVNISSDAQDLEGMFYADDNEHEGETEDVQNIEVSVDENGVLDDPSKKGAVEEMKAELDKGRKAAEDEVKRFQEEEDAKKKAVKSSAKKKTSELNDDDILAAMMKQPFNIVMENFGVNEQEFIAGCRQLFIEGHYTYTVTILGFSIVLRSKDMNNHVDFADYMRRILITQISQREFETLRQLRQLSYAIIKYGKEDWSELSVADKFDKLLEKDEMAITMLVNASVDFWRISHLMMHPGALGFLESTPQT